MPSEWASSSWARVAAVSPVKQRFEQAANSAAVGLAQHVAHLFGRDLALAMRDRLVEDRQAVAGRAFGGAGDGLERLFLDIDAFGLRNMGEMLGQLFGRNPAKVEPLAARQDGNRDLVHLGGGEQEFHMRRRLLERFQKRVEGALRQHVNFVDDVDLVARRDGGIAHRLDDLADVVDAGVAGGVHFDHVDVAALGDRSARLAHAAGFDRRAALPVRADAVQRLGDQPRGRSLADPANARSAGRHGRSGRARSRWPASSPSRPGRSARRRSAGDICGRARGNARPSRGFVCSGRSSPRPGDSSSMGGF